MMDMDDIKQEDQVSTDDNASPDGAAIGSVASDVNDAADDQPTPEQQADVKMLKIFNNLAEGKDARDGVDDPQPESDPDKVEDDADEESVKDGGSDTDPDIESKRRHALKRWQWSDEMLDALPQERLAELGDKAIQQQTEFSKVADERAELRRQIEDVLTERGIKAVDPVPDSEKKTATEEDSDDIDPDKASDGEVPVVDMEQINKLLSPLEDDDLLSEATEPLRKVFGLLIEQIISRPTGDDDSAYKTALEQSVRRSDELRLLIARNELISDFPQLKDDARYEEMLDKLYEMSSLPSYRNDGKLDINALMRDASLMTFGSELQATQERQRDARYRRQLDGQPDDDGHKSPEGKTMDSDDQMIAIWKELAKGKSPAEARRAVLGANA